MTTHLSKGFFRVLTHRNGHLLRQFSTCRCLLSDKENQYTITTEVDGIRTICLNDTKKRNALSLAMLRQLERDLYAESKDLRAIILTHTGPVFSAGHDLKELTTKEGRDYHAQVFSTCTSVMSSLQEAMSDGKNRITVAYACRKKRHIELYDRICWNSAILQELPVPVIAKVSGLATAAGCQLVASCDIAVATEKSGFATPGVNVGLFCSTPAVAVGRSVPRKVAMEMLFTGNPISAKDALLHGLISKVVPEEKLEEETMAIAKKICETSKSVVALGKATFYAQINMDRKQAYNLTEMVMVENLSMMDGQEGIKAFFEKRKAKWTHKTDKLH